MAESANAWSLRKKYLYAVPVEAAVSAAPVGAAGGVLAGTYPNPSLSSSAFGSVVTETSFGQASAPGVASTASRSDHTHGTPADPTATITAAYTAQDMRERLRRLMLVP